VSVSEASDCDDNRSLIDSLYLAFYISVIL
jgi:hypothetical protein